ncbi:hypothetical protein PC116_g11015 [Phytophthora cactorum]|nr:hypothetical protein PC114_g8183 [Phytophthora cactorum]KAG3019146.1 hypothetical protein PC120_g10016 [Phytophthora cactorum]KAG3178350.1 hypothetical protein C6341_g8014 [Phytophthora cactorum]KAG4054693.1 hypothetical protein PC123_g10193 [Phytophthora cactorum]KAG4241058.1 hypothetical protein PC116_g11015 [Phytophthora cactorum]
MKSLVRPRHSLVFTLKILMADLAMNPEALPVEVHHTCLEAETR